jgi:hypothetical protein
MVHQLQLVLVQYGPSFSRRLTHVNLTWWDFDISNVLNAANVFSMCSTEM